MVRELKTSRETKTVGRKDRLASEYCKRYGLRLRPTHVTGQVKVVVITEQTSWFRGDDDVSYYHDGCEPRP